MQKILKISFLTCALIAINACTGKATNETPTNSPPEFTNKVEGVIEIELEFGNRNIGYQVDATDPDSDPIEFSLLGRSADVFFLDNKKLEFKNTANPIVGNVFNIRVQAFDGTASATQHLKITIIESSLDDKAKVLNALSTGNPTWLPESSAALVGLIQEEAEKLGSNSALKRVAEVIRRLESNDFSFDLIECNSSECSSDAIKSEYESEFYLPLRDVKRSLESLDQRNFDLFNDESRRLLRLMVLLGDYYRERVRFPLDTDQMQDYLKSYFAEHVVFYSRDHNRLMPDMGSFSGSDFSRVVPEDVRVQMTSKRAMRAAGVYAIPGQSFLVTRNDNNEDLSVRVMLNTLRPGTIKIPAKLREWNGELQGYVRPKLVMSTPITINPGEAIRVSTPYGGPVQLLFSKGGEAVDLTFEKVGRHAYWNGPEDTEHFNKALNEGIYNWVELATPNIEIHSRRDYFFDTLEQSDFGDIESLAEATQYYMYDLLQQSAGLAGPNISYNEGIHGFAEEKAWPLEEVDYVRHANAEFALCGFGCSGNPLARNPAGIPLDVFSWFSPLRLVYLHEVSHHLENYELVFSGWKPLHSLTEIYASFPASEGYKKYKTALGRRCLKFWRDDDLYQILQDGFNSPNPSAYAAENIDYQNTIFTRAIYVQFSAVAQNQGSIGNGWFLLARLHLLHNEFYRAIRSEALWNKQRESLGFGTYSRAEANKDILPRNDWLIIAMSVVSGLDFSDYAEMWGIQISDKAKNQINHLGFPKVQRKFYASELEYACTLDVPELPVDGKSAWPYLPRGSSSASADIRLSKTLHSDHKDGEICALHSVKTLQFNNKADVAF